MIQTGGCYCGTLRYCVTAQPRFNALCYCRACQHIAGGGPQHFVLIPTEGFAVTQGNAATFSRPDLERPVTRSFCKLCGTHVFTNRPGLPGVILKVGTLDDPTSFGAPQAAIYLAEKQPFHSVPEGLAQFDGLPPRREPPRNDRA